MNKRALVILACLGVVLSNDIEASEVKGDKLYIKQEVKTYRDDVVRYPVWDMYVITGSEPVYLEKVREVKGEVKGLSLGMEVGRILKESVKVVEKGSKEEKKKEEEKRGEEKKVEVKSEVVVYKVYFDFGKSELKKCEREKLKAWVERVKPKRVKVYGYADIFGGKRFNKRLSERRADVVRRVLEELGIEVEEAKGMGESDVECVYGLNRVVEVRVVE